MSIENENTENSGSMDNSSMGDPDLVEAFESVGISAADLEGDGVMLDDLSGQEDNDSQLDENNEDADDLDLSELIGEFGSEEKEVSDEQLEDALGEEPGESEDSNGELLEQLNALGMVHNGDSFKVDSVDDLKGLVQKGKDYTLKTQGLADERKDWEAQKDIALKEYDDSVDALNQQIDQHQETLQQYQVWDLALSQIKDEDPDLFSDLMGKVNQAKRFVTNPVMDHQMKQMNDRLAKAEKGAQERENNLIVKEFQNDLRGNSKIIEQVEKQLNLKVDESLIQDRYKQGDSVKQAVWALYGDKVMKLKESRAKVSKNKKVAASKRGVGAGGSARKGRSKSNTKSIDWANTSYTDLANAIGNKI